MAYTFKAPEPGSQNAVDFDFFDDPEPRDSPTNLGNSGNLKSLKKDANPNHKNNDSKSDRSYEGNSHAKQTNLRSPRSPDREGDDSYSSDYSSDDSYSTYTDSDSSRSNTVVKIEAKIPRVEDDKAGEDSDHGGEPSRGRSESQSSNDGRKSRANPGHVKHPDDRQSRSRSNSSDYSRSTDATTDSDTDSDVTDVSPLHSPHDYISKHSQKDTKYSKPLKSPTHKEVSFRRPPSASDSGSGRHPLIKADSDDIDLKLLMRAVMEMEQSNNPKLVTHTKPNGGRLNSSMPHHNPTSANRRNFSFTNDSVRTIDLENQRLMQNIMKFATKSKKIKKSPKQKSAPIIGTKKATSAINRNKDQLRIERENFELLYRLQAVKPTKEVERDHLIHDYDDQMLFGTSVAATHPHDKKRRAPSPYTVSFNPTFSPAGDASGEVAGKRTRPVSATVRSRPGSAVNRPSRPYSATTRPQSATNAGKKRPQSAKTTGSAALALSSGLGSKPTWDERW